MLRKLLLSDSSISLILHGLKSVLALAINWMVLAQFSSANYVTWAVSSSILVVATASDLGIGQYATTQLIHATPDRWTAIVRDSLVALAPLALGAVAFVYLALGNQPTVYKAAMATFIGLRVLSIPFGAVLNAVNQFKLRKAIEVCVYLASALLIAWVAYADKPVLWALLTLNALFMVGGFVTIRLAARYFDVRALWVNLPECARLGRVYRESVHFMANNLCGLLTYGGFIWVSSFILAEEALAKLAVLHTFILINAYQVYDVVLRARQADLIRAEHVKRMRILNTVLMVVCPIFAFIFGDALLSLITKGMEFSQGEIVLFSVFLVIELGFLLIQSVVQVSPQLVRLLSRYALVKLALQAMAVVTYSLALSGAAQTLGNYIALLTVSSLLGYVFCSMHLRAHLRLAGG